MMNIDDTIIKVERPIAPETTVGDSAQPSEKKPRTRLTIKTNIRAGVSFNCRTY